MYLFTGRPAVWILVHSYVFWSAQRADCQPGGRNLGFPGVDVTWHGIHGLCWPKVLQEVVSLSWGTQVPVVLVLHLGGNDLCLVWIGELLTLMKTDLERFSGFVPELILVW